MTRWVLLYFAVINLYGLVLMGVDKRKAVRRRWRIPESVLLTVAAVGGAMGAFCGMMAFRHKTRHPRFAVGLPIILIIQVVLLCLCLKIGKGVD